MRRSCLPRVSLGAGSASATTWYVSPTGNDGYSGLSPSQPFQSWWTANHHLQPGDTLKIMPGTYTDLGIGVSGTPTAPVTYTAYNPNKPPLIAANDQYPAVFIEANYVHVSFLEVTTGLTSLAAGLMVFQANHVQVDHVTAYNSGGGGVMSVQSDYVRFIHDVAYDNSFAASNQTSGIGIGFGVNSDTLPGVHNVINDCVSYGNMDKVPMPGASYTTDGDGIIIDTMNNNGYVGSTVVNNNITYGNGGSGVRIFRSDNVQVTNNTSVGNLQDPLLSGLKGEISAVSSANVIVRNNVVQATAATAYAFVDAGTSGDRFDYNISNGGIAAQRYTYTSNAVWGSHNLLGVDPAFQPGTTYELAAGSPALATADGVVAPTFDIRNVQRPLNHVNVDRGAYQQSP